MKKRVLLMTKRESIAAIKEHLQLIWDVNDPYLQNLRADERSGVQKCLAQWEKKQQVQKQLEEQYQTMQIFEEACWAQGDSLVAGIDEVGRGPLAGPVVAAAVILPRDHKILGLNDSKQLSAKKRETLAAAIKEQALAIGIGRVEPAEIDRINIYQASRVAMTQAVTNLKVTADHLLIDAMTLDLPIAQEKIIKGDARSVSIAAASIIAKVYRDHLMADYHKQYPYYEFDKNAGYGTRAHLEGIKAHGITPIHRKTFAPIKNFIL